MIGPDGLHHSDRGYACLAASLGAAIVTAVASAHSGPRQGAVPPFKVNANGVPGWRRQRRANARPWPGQSLRAVHTSPALIGRE